MHGKRWIVLAAGIGTSVMLAACGGSSGTPRPVNMTIEMDEFALDPTEIVVEPGAQVKITLKNEGALIHSIYIMDMGYESQAPFDEEDEQHALWHAAAQPGATAVLEFTAPSEPGTYQIVCGVPGHLEVGMRGTLVVSEP